MHLEQLNGLFIKTKKFSDENGEALIIKFEENIALLLAWLDYIERHYKTGTADELIVAASSCARECAAYLSLGLVRPTIFGLRTVVDLCLAWLYFKDHSIEWERVNSTGDGFKLKKDIFEYLSVHVDGFSSRHGLLRTIVTRKTEDVYRFFSAHIHCQSIPVLIEVGNLSDVVFDKKAGYEMIDIAFSTAEYLSDIFSSVYVRVWHVFPILVKNNITSRFISQPQKLKFFESA